MTTCEVFAQEVGQTAGTVWQLLDKRGSLTISQIVKEIRMPRDQIMQSIGWLAREGKLTVREEGRKKVASLIS